MTDDLPDDPIITLLGAMLIIGILLIAVSLIWFVLVSFGLLGVGILLVVGAVTGGKLYDPDDT